MDPQAINTAVSTLKGPQQPPVSPDPINHNNTPGWYQSQYLNTPSAISQAMAQVNPKGKDTLSSVGKAIATPAYAGYCLQWVDDQTGNQNRLPTAVADYQARSQTGAINTSSDNIPKGARVYFAPDQSNGGLGHVGLSNGDGSFTSATDNGVKTFDISDWEKNTGQKYLGYAAPQQTQTNSEK